MNTFRQLARKPETIPAVAAGYLADSGELTRRVLRRLAVSGVLECHGRGPAARWKRKGTVSP